MSGELRDGEVAPLDIRSEQGQPCTVENPWPMRQVQVWRDDQPAGLYTEGRMCTVECESKRGSVTLPRLMTDLITGKRHRGVVELAPYGAMVLNDFAKGKE